MGGDDLSLLWFEEAERDGLSSTIDEMWSLADQLMTGIDGDTDSQATKKLFFQYLKQVRIWQQHKIEKQHEEEEKKMEQMNKGFSSRFKMFKSKKTKEEEEKKKKEQEEAKKKKQLSAAGLVVDESDSSDAEFSPTWDEWCLFALLHSHLVADQHSYVSLDQGAIEDRAMLMEAVSEIILDLIQRWDQQTLNAVGLPLPDDDDIIEFKKLLEAIFCLRLGSDNTHLCKTEGQKEIEIILNEELNQLYTHFLFFLFVYSCLCIVIFVIVAVLMVMNSIYYPVYMLNLKSKYAWLIIYYKVKKNYY